MTVGFSEVSSAQIDQDSPLDTTLATEWSENQQYLKLTQEILHWGMDAI